MVLSFCLSSTFPTISGAFFLFLADGAGRGGARSWRTTFLAAAAAAGSSGVLGFDCEFLLSEP
jgi:hypothetical protein